MLLCRKTAQFTGKENLNWCRLGSAAENAPREAKEMLKAYLDTKSEELLKRMILALELRKGSESAFSASLNACDNEAGKWNKESLESYLSDKKQRQRLYLAKY